MRIAIIGNSGSGKSSLAHQLVARHGMPMLDLDTVAWEPDKIAAERHPRVAMADVRAFCADNTDWVVEGCYAGLIRATLEYAPNLLFLQPGLQACLANCRSRPWEPHKYRSKSEQDGKLEHLLEWVREYYERDGELSLRSHQELYDSYTGPKCKLVQRAGQDFVKQLELANA